MLEFNVGEFETERVIIRTPGFEPVTLTCIQWADSKGKK